jgi:hypothetical protein
MATSRLNSSLKPFLILLVIAIFGPVDPAAAQEDAAAELINMINELRASYGLAPYTVDDGLMALAQAHSEYQASIHTSTHEHSDGQVPPQLGVVENVAGGDIDFLNPQTAVYEIWADPVHLRTMVGYAAGSVGAGIADDGITVYYTLEVRPADAAAKVPGPSDPVTTPALLTPITFVPLVTVTPRSDGAIVHVVGYGQTLWAIALAYGVQVEQLRAWNNMPEGSSELYADQMLLVRPANLAPPTPTPGAEATRRGSQPAPTLFPAAGRTTIPASPTETATASAPAAEHSASAETRAGNPPPAQPGRRDSISLVPIFAGISILIGCALLAILLAPKRAN